MVATIRETGVNIEKAEVVLQHLQLQTEVTQLYSPE